MRKTTSLFFALASASALALFLAALLPSCSVVVVVVDAFLVLPAANLGNARTALALPRRAAPPPGGGGAAFDAYARRSGRRGSSSGGQRSEEEDGAVGDGSSSAVGGSLFHRLSERRRRLRRRWQRRRPADQFIGDAASSPPPASPSSVADFESRRSAPASSSSSSSPPPSTSLFEFGPDGRELRGLLPALLPDPTKGDSRRSDLTAHGPGPGDNGRRVAVDRACSYHPDDRLVRLLIGLAAGSGGSRRRGADTGDDKSDEEDCAAADSNERFTGNDACWALDACRGDVTEAWVRILTAQKVRRRREIAGAASGAASNRRPRKSAAPDAHSSNGATATISYETVLAEEMLQDPTLARCAGEPMEVEFQYVGSKSKLRSTERNRAQSRKRERKLLVRLAVVAAVCRSILQAAA